MQLIALNDKHLILARDAQRHKSYLCPECLSAVRLRKGEKKQPHFFHLTKALACSLEGKSLEHLNAQLHLQKLLEPNELLLERPFPEIGRIADVVWEEKKLIFEIQCSPIPLLEAKERIENYALAGYRVVWILHEKNFNKERLSPSEAFLRSSQTCFFTDIDSEGKGSIYNQLERLSKTRRFWKSEKLKLSTEQLQQKPPAAVETILPKEKISLKMLYRFCINCLLELSAR